jgi:hypothetical protein
MRRAAGHGGRTAILAADPPDKEGRSAAFIQRSSQAAQTRPEPREGMSGPTRYELLGTRSQGSDRARITESSAFDLPHLNGRRSPDEKPPASVRFWEQSGSGEAPAGAARLRERRSSTAPELRERPMPGCLSVRVLSCGLGCRGV